MLRDLFTNPAYKGSYAYGKHRDKYRVVPREKWLICEHAFPAIISDEQWADPPHFSVPIETRVLGQLRVNGLTPIAH
jgi:hypothetical protein